MKKTKRILAIFMSLAMVMSMMIAMSVTSFAADGHTISVKDSDTHTYKVYQVLTGTLAKAGDKNLGNPAWGADAIENPGDVNAFITGLEGKSETEVAALVAAKVDTSAAGRGEVSKGNPLSGLATGYYVLIDKTDLTKEGFKNDTKALNVVKVVNDINGIDIKHDTTSDEKKIASDTLGKDSGTNTIDGDTDNVSVGDTVNYEIKAKVPAMATDYNYFYFVINDTLDEGLTFTDGSIKVYKGSVAAANELAAKDYQIKTGTDAGDKTFMVALNDAKSLAGQDIIVTYSAVVNENAKIGEIPNKNTSTVTFSNDPNHNYDGEKYPGFPDKKESTVLGETPESVTKTYVTGIEIQKVDQDGNVLTGATFEISGQSTKKVLTVAETFTADEKGDYYKLKNGTYTKEAPKADEMEKAAEGATKGYVVDNTYTGADKVVIGETTYRPYAPATDKDKEIFVLKKGSSSLYDSTTTKYKKSESKTVEDATSSHKASKPVDANGLVRFDGLGEGTYKIKEIATPSGYNTLPDLTVTITFNESGEKVWSFSGGNGTYDSEEGIYKITIENQKGSELPETGGIGTVIFYVLGSILVIGSAIVLISRKRMENR